MSLVDKDGKPIPGDTTVTIADVLEEFNNKLKMLAQAVGNLNDSILVIHNRTVDLEKKQKQMEKQIKCLDRE